MRKIILAIIICVCALAGCETKVPENAQMVNDEVTTYPDVKDVTVPKSIAPLNFQLQNNCDDVIFEFSNGKGGSMTAKGNDEKEILINPQEWKKLLSESGVTNIECTPYLKKKDAWLKYNTFKINVLDEPIDSFVTYRLIEPSYMSTGQIGLYEFNLTTGEEKVIMRRCQNYSTENLHDQSCVNCHCAQKGNPSNKMFYYRGKDGGLILTYNGKINKINTKVEGMFKGTTYPAWHPTLPFITFSENDVWQDFTTLKKSKIECFDRRADLILYDIEKNEIFIIKESREMETNPTWSPDGEYLYFALSDSVMKPNVMPEFEYPKLKYDIARMKFDPETKSFSEPEIVLNMTKEDRSATFPRISHDNKYLLVVISNFGASSHTHIEGDLYAMNLETKELIKCEAANSDQAESYHDFSSHANWFVFYSRREDGNYGRAFVSYIDSTGKCTKPFQLPHKEPQMDKKRLKLYNMIEFANAGVRYDESDFYDVLWNQEVIQAKNDPRNKAVDGNTGASVKKDGTDGNTGASVIRDENTSKFENTEKNIHE